ncbi:30S ribosomal protein S17 [archaeon]|nr:MAG: 30S ribosomal protein S17 [archaeon]
MNQYEERKKRRQALVGEVVSVKCSKSITVRVEYQKYFPKYDKHISRHNKFMAHDEQEQCKLGDVVRIVPCRPMSKRKRHALIDIIRRPKLPMEDEERAEKTVPLEEVKVSASVEAK